jgi:hypothetical protein
MKAQSVWSCLSKLAKLAFLWARFYDKKFNLIHLITKVPIFPIMIILIILSTAKSTIDWQRRILSKSARHLSTKEHYLRDSHLFLPTLHPYHKSKALSWCTCLQSCCCMAQNGQWHLRMALENGKKRLKCRLVMTSHRVLTLTSRAAHATVGTRDWRKADYSSKAK